MQPFGSLILSGLTHLKAYEESGRYSFQELDIFAAKPGRYEVRSSAMTFYQAREGIHQALSPFGRL